MDIFEKKKEVFKIHSVRKQKQRRTWNEEFQRKTLQHDSNDFAETMENTLC